MKNQYRSGSIYYLFPKLKKKFSMLKLDYNKNSILHDKYQWRKELIFFMLLNIFMKSIFIIQKWVSRMI
jgi:hypothetical protein